MMVEGPFKQKEGENETFLNAVSVKAWAYREDTNHKFRASMEDGHVCVDSFNQDPDQGLFCLFDGHGGPEAVDYCKNRFEKEFLKAVQESQDDVFEALESCFKKLDDQLKVAGAISSGATATIIYIKKEDNQKVIYCANVGDTKSYLVTSTEAIKMSYDDKPSDPEEADRIKKQGGFIFRNRVAGQLAITRALGDHQLKEEGVIATPHVNRRELNVADKYIISASDGLWDVLEEQVIFKCRTQLNKQIKTIELT